jgi:hypothetical protein
MAGPAMLAGVIAARRTFLFAVAGDDRARFSVTRFKALILPKNQR